MSKKKKKKEAVEVFSPPPDTPTEVIVEAIEQGSLTLHGLMPWSSNYTFLCTIEHEDLSFSAVYKPSQGERPLWDFDTGTLCNREVASYVVSSSIGDWALVPPTVLREGPHGPLAAVETLNLGAVGAVPGGMGVVEGGKIPYKPEAAKLRESSTDKAAE